MADYSDSKSIYGTVYPVGTLETTWRHLEPLLDVDQLRTRYLAGVPLISQLPDPVTRKLVRITDEGLRDIIEGAVGEVETSAHMRIMPAQIRERHPFDRVEFEAFGYFRLKQRPISSIEQLAIVGSDGTNFWEVPPAWVETGNMAQGQINILPLAPAHASAAYTGAAGGPNAMIYMTLLSRLGHIPAYWDVRYTVGFPDGCVPRVVNDAIGTAAAIQVLSMLSSTYMKSSQSLGIDGMSQSTSGPGPQQFTQRINELQEDLKRKVKKLKVMVGQSLFSGNV